MGDVWDRVRALEGRTLVTARGKPFRVVAVDARSACIVPESTGKVRRIARAEIEGAVAFAREGGDISPIRLREAGISEANPAYVAVIANAVTRRDVGAAGEPAPGGALGQPSASAPVPGAKATRSYRLGEAFPPEGFVQKAIEAYFARLGFETSTDGHADLVCAHRGSGARWVVEAKGVTSEVGLDFRTGLGQLLQRMPDPDWFYGIAVPDVPKFRNQLGQVRLWVREVLRLHWLLVDEAGDVRIVAPGAVL